MATAKMIGKVKRLTGWVRTRKAEAREGTPDHPETPEKPMVKRPYSETRWRERSASAEPKRIRAALVIQGRASCQREFELVSVGIGLDGAPCVPLGELGRRVVLVRRCAPVGE